MYRKEIERLEANIIELQENVILKEQFFVYEKTRQLVGDGTDSSFLGILPSFINTLDTSLNRLKLTYLQDQFSSAFKSTVLEMANTEPLTLHNLPLKIKDRFTGKNGKLFRINVYPYKNIWNDTIFLDRFVNELSSINEKITGWPVLFVEFKDSLRYYGYKTIQLTLISLMLLLLIAMRSIKHVLIIMVSIILGFIWLIGVLILVNNPLNLLNIWIFPVILSVGMNNAILILQCWKQEKNLDTVYRSTGKAILFAMMTIIITVSPFWFTNHIGLTSIVSVLLAGLGCSFLANIIIIPPLLGEEIPQ
jgi:predicted RND superfamily exporter protein